MIYLQDDKLSETRIKETNISFGHKKVKWDRRNLFVMFNITTEGFNINILGEKQAINISVKPDLSVRTSAIFLKLLQHTVPVSSQLFG